MNMKKTVTLIAAALVCLSFTMAAASKKEIRRVVYQTNLHCEKCAEKIRENVSFEKGVKDLKIDVDAKKVEIKFDAEKNDTLSLRKAINKLGYSAKVIEFEQ